MFINISFILKAITRYVTTIGDLRILGEYHYPDSREQTQVYCFGDPEAVVNLRS
jgi:hypothetical protein